LTPAFVLPYFTEANFGRVISSRKIDLTASLLWKEPIGGSKSIGFKLKGKGKEFHGAANGVQGVLVGGGACRSFGE
jgi:hypothetical protein